MKGKLTMWKPNASRLSYNLVVILRKRLDNLEKSNQFYSDKFDSWQEEKSVLLQQISELKTEYQVKMDEAEQYSRRNCLIITGVKEQEGEDIDRVVLDIFEKSLTSVWIFSKLTDLID